MDGCEHISESWTLSSLISAFIQLFITFILLSSSAFVFFLSKFLSLLGLSLPCHSFCFHTLLLHFPSRSLSSLHLSIISKFPHSQLSFNLLPHPHQHHALQLEPPPSYTSKGPTTHTHTHDANFTSDVSTLRRSPSNITAHLYANDVQEDTIDASDDNKLTYHNTASLDIPNHRLGHGENAVMVLQQHLELEQSARAALCAELEKERTAAATAADEAMAMISRLQEEKASVEIEARQYQRILEEKSAYDAEEMTILKEIIVRRETEIHFLEKQLEEYRKRFQQENEGLECQVDDTQEYYDIVDPSWTEKLPAADIYQGKQTPDSCSIVHDGDEAAQEIQETTGVLSTDNSNSNDNVVKADQGQAQMQVMEPHVHDVHIVASKYNTCSRGGVEKMVDSFMHNSGASKCDSSSEFSDSHKVEDSSNYGRRVDLGINKSCSDIVERFSSFSTSPSTSLFSQRHNSLSSVDQERLKIDCEIGCLRARLRAVQKEKEKLKSSLQSQDQGKTERLLEDIAVLLREIRHLREPQKIARQASLPPLSSKETSKRRRARSTCVGVGQSSSS